MKTIKEASILIIVVLVIGGAGFFLSEMGPEILTADLFTDDYPAEYGGDPDYGNVLEVMSFVDGEERPGATITIDDDLVSDEVSLPGTIVTPDHITETENDLKNVVLEAGPALGSGEFAGWSGCDSDTERECQVSVTDFQTRRVEAHFKIVEDDPEPQLWSISENPIEGELPDDLWETINPRVAFKAAYLDLEEEIPDSVGELDALQLQLGRSGLEEELPEELGDMSRVEYLGLYDNEFEGEIPEELGDLTDLKYLLLYMNQLEEELPEELGNLTDLVRFEIHDNEHLEGEIPAELANLEELTPSEMRFYNNRFDSAEEGLMEDSNWKGVNFFNNHFTTGPAMDVLEEAAERTGTYIDFCADDPSSPQRPGKYEEHPPLDGGTVWYDHEGEMEDVEINDEVNDALEAGWDVYIPLKMRQEWWVYGPKRGVSPCTPPPQCCPEYDPDTGAKTDCAPCGGCSPNRGRGYAVPGDIGGGFGNVMCARLIGSQRITTTEELKDNSVGVPEYLRHVDGYDSCHWWWGDQNTCQPICEHPGCVGNCGPAGPCEVTPQEVTNRSPGDPLQDEIPQGADECREVRPVNFYPRPNIP